MTNPSVAIASSNEQQDGDLLKTFPHKAKSLVGHLAFGLVQIHTRGLVAGESIEVHLAPIVRDSERKHPRKLAELQSDLAAQCAVDRAEDLIEQIAEDELEESGCHAKETARISRGEPETKSTALSVKGKGG